MATVKRFVLERACVFITDRDKEEIDKAVSDIGNNVSSSIQDDFFHDLLSFYHFDYQSLQIIMGNKA